jgi:hypothetical protein
MYLSYGHDMRQNDRRKNVSVHLVQKKETDEYGSTFLSSVVCSLMVGKVKVLLMNSFPLTGSEQRLAPLNKLLLSKWRQYTYERDQRVTYQSLCLRWASCLMSAHCICRILCRRILLSIDQTYLWIILCNWRQHVQIKESPVNHYLYDEQCLWSMDAFPHESCVVEYSRTYTWKDSSVCSTDNSNTRGCSHHVMSFCLYVYCRYSSVRLWVINESSSPSI